MYGDIQIRISKILEVKAEEKEKAISEAGSKSSRRTKLKLPKMELPCFDGGLENWIPHGNEMIPGSRAHRFSGSYTHTGENYENVIRALKSRFEDKNLLVELYSRKLLNLVVLNAQRQNTILDHLYDEISAYLQSFKSLNIPSEYLEVFLFPLVESCLPTEILQVWQRTPEASYGRDDDQEVEQRKGDRLKALMSFFTSRMGENNPKPNFPPRRLQFKRNNEPTAAQLFVSKNENDKHSRGSFLSTNYDRESKCIFCDKMGLVNWKCLKVGRMTRDEQLKKMSDAGVCFKCLKRSHLRRHCRTKTI
ncbi:hypothetical protein LAZ67_21001318 [Cordylochernes scorpioides]|uniref:CCHC-type domain-containing protein n=1 Tax=Cordylochernes scorpioides TaxID=51811 RepID=A0ABY6LLV6_9ARAC|nr:hypothetical protein LAZ67_21001318 [Cordylochernes scorpioides]